MKILKDWKTEEKYKKYREKANKGCDICPQCGSSNLIIRTFSYDSIVYMYPRKKVDCYRCVDCGCEFRSEPYKIPTKGVFNS